ncbi:Hypothetical predicted protein [Octopus vulgaris]|uniref:Uncharacterized protein n=1 Tax=Octopus vulgaris TaxID=6645 RepID=A0AA36BL90_OCTVU|nr:Hypothetical predicted protein [Octopus vulgaris]
MNDAYNSNIRNNNNKQQHDSQVKRQLSETPKIYRQHRYGELQFHLGNENIYFVPHGIIFTNPNDLKINRLLNTVEFFVIRLRRKLDESDGNILNGDQIQ